MDGTSTYHFGIFDYDGCLRVRRFAKAQGGDALRNGFSFPDVIYRWDTSEAVYDAGATYGSENCSADVASGRNYPFEPNAKFYIADFTGPSQSLSPREVLKRQIARAEAMGFRARAAFECEFTVLNETAESLRVKNYQDPIAWAPDNRCWSADSAGVYSSFVTGLEEVMQTLNVPLFGLGTELGPGCFEATLAATEPLKAADDYGLFRTFTKTYCRRQNLTASFLAQLGKGFQGLSGHVNLSMTDRQGAPVFAASDGKLNDAMSHFIGGILTLLPECAALCSHTVNAWRRMVPGNWAPRTPSWDFNNYGVAVRVVAATPEATRIEFRVPAADTNPHLALALALGAGLWGIENRIPLPERATGDVRSFVPKGLRALPRNLGEAAERLAVCEEAHALFGAEFVSHFAMTRTHEDNVLRRAVSAEELARYLEAI
jgi:glutamine synthetase